MASASLKTKTLSGMIWSFVQRFGTMAISFVSNIVLARLLTPDDLPYGLKYIWQLAKKQGIDTPNIDKVYSWGLEKIK